MSPRNPVLACVPAVFVALTLSLPARAANPPPPAPTADATPSPAIDLQAGKRVRNTGIGTLALGTVMLGVGGGLEHKRRTDICAVELSEDHADTCDRSKMANITVLAMGVTLFIGGAVLLGLGQSKMNRARRALDSRRVAFSPQVGRGFAGAVLSARF